MPTRQHGPAVSTQTPHTYSVWVGLVYVFNLMVGTGALAMPAALSGAGWALGSGAVLLLAALSFLAATFVLEAQAVMCALRHGDTKASASATEDDADDAPLVSRHAHPHYTLDESMELGEMARALLGRRGRAAFYFVLCLYLYGDLCIYSAAIATSITDVLCTYRTNGTSWNETSDLDACWESHDFTRVACYRTSLLASTALLAPLAARPLHSSRYVQLAATAARWLALGGMMGVASARLATAGAAGSPAAVRVEGLPALFGTAVYAFMWHHSAPGLVAPMRDKRSRVNVLLSLDYALVAGAYLALSLTGAFAFRHLEPLYTLNFVPAPADPLPAKILHYLLASFPLLALSASYPVVGVTLRRNVCTLLPEWWSRAALPLTVLPPLLITLLVRDVGLLVSVTGCVAGVGIQYVMPAALVVSARQAAARRLGVSANPHASPARSHAAPLLLQAWAALAVSLVAAHLATS